MKGDTMSERKPKRYCGQGKIRSGQYGDMVDVLLFEDDIAEIIKRQGELQATGHTAVRLTFLGKQSPKNAWTHYGVIDEWEPDRERAQQPAAAPASPPADTDHRAIVDAPAASTEDDLPF